MRGDQQQAKAIGVRDGLTAFEGIRFRVVAYIGSLWFRDLHLAVLLSLSQSQVLLVPLQTACNGERSLIRTAKRMRCSLLPGARDRRRILEDALWLGVGAGDGRMMDVRLLDNFRRGHGGSSER